MRSRILAVAASAIVVLALLGCGASDSADEPPATLDAETNPNAPTDEGEPEQGGTLRFAVDAETTGFDPVSNTFALAGNLIASSIYDPLLRITPDRTTEPHLAESVTPNADYTVWTIVARPGVTFHDGTPFDAEAIRVNLEERREGSLTSVALESVDRVEVVDSSTVAVHLARPWSAFNYLLASQTGYMVSPTALLEGVGPDAVPVAEHPVGTGPFRFQERQVDSHLRVARNDDYWQNGQPHLDGIEFRIISDPTTRAASLESGAVDAMITESVDDVAHFRQADGYQQAEDLAGEESFVMLNQAQPPFDNPHARRALVLATDRAALAELVNDGLTPLADQPFTPSERWFVDDAGYPANDLEAAAAAVEQYKSDTGEPVLSFELLVRPGENQNELAQVLQQQWAAADIEFEVTTLESTAFLLRVVQGDYEAATFRNFANADPDFLYNFLHSSKAKGIGELSINFTQTRHPGIDAALEEARGSADPVAREAAYAEAVRLLNEELPYVWLYHNLWALSASDRVGGLATVAEVGFSRQDAKPWWGALWLRS